MAEEQSNINQVQDRGLFDFMGKKENVEEEKPQEAAIVATEMENLKVSEPEKEEAENTKKKPSLLEKLHRSDSSSSSSSSSEEEVEERGEKIKRKKKKGLKEKIKEKISGDKVDEVDDITIPIEKVEVSHPEEKKTFMEKIKEKLPGKKPEETAPVVAVEAPAPVVAEVHGTEAEPKEEKKGIFDKIKEKIPRYHKTEGDKKETATDLNYD